MPMITMNEEPERSTMHQTTDEDSISTRGESSSFVNENLRAKIIEAEAMIKQNREIQEVTDKLLIVHGMAPGPKPEGVMRMVYENLDELNMMISGNEKLEKEKEIIEKLEADIVGFAMHKINSVHNDNVNSL